MTQASCNHPRTWQRREHANVETPDHLDGDLGHFGASELRLGGPAFQLGQVLRRSLFRAEPAAGAVLELLGKILSIRA